MPTHPSIPPALRRLASAVLVIATAAACDDITVPCISCPGTTRLEIHGDSVVVAGDAIVLRAIARRETVLFDFLYEPARRATWGTSTSTIAHLVIQPVVSSDSSTWGRAVVIGRAGGMARITARADGLEAVKLVRVIPAS